MLNQFTSSVKSKPKVELINNKIPEIFQVEFPSLEKGESFDHNDIKLIKRGADEVFRHNNDEHILSVCVDGSVHSEYGLSLVLNEFIPYLKNSQKNPKYIVNYVYYSSEDKKFNYNNSKDNIVYKYSSILGKYKSFGTFYIEDRWSKNHALEQIVGHTKKDESNLLVVGYFGIKGPKVETTELSRGINYLLEHSVSPTILVKELKLRENEKGYNWLFVLDPEQTNNRTKLIDSFISIIDIKKDKIYGIGVYETSIPDYNKVSIEFNNYCKLKNFENFEYEDGIYSKGGVSDPIVSKVNYGKINFHFVAFINSSFKHRLNPENNDYIRLISKCSSNICFINV